MGVNEIKKSEMMSGIRQLDIISTVCWGYFSLLPGVENAECLRNSLKKKWQIVYFFVVLLPKSSSVGTSAFFYPFSVAVSTNHSPQAKKTIKDPPNYLITSSFIMFGGVKEAAIKGRIPPLFESGLRHR